MADVKDDVEVNVELDDLAKDLIDEQAFEAKVEDRLNKTFVTEEPLDDPAVSKSDADDPTLDDDDDPAGKSGDDDEPTPREVAEEKKLEREMAAEAEAKKEEEAAAEENTDTKDETKTAKDEDVGKSKDEGVPPLSDAYFRAAIHRGMSEEEIKDFYTANPELANKTFANIYEAVNRSSKEFADIGRARKKMDAEAATAPVVKPSAETAEGFKGLDMDKIRSNYPDDPIVDLIATQQAQSKLLYDEVQELKQTGSTRSNGLPSGAEAEQQRALSQEANAINQQMDSFFRDDDMKGYNEFYGELPKNAADWNSMSPGQRANRWAVIEMMDEMMAGAEVLGREMNIEEAMHLAHLSVSESLREKVIRDGILSKVEKRNKSMTLKPSGTVTPDATAPASKQELEDVTATRLDKVFNS